MSLYSYHSSDLTSLNVVSLLPFASPWYDKNILMLLNLSDGNENSKTNKWTTMSIPELSSC